MKKCKNHLPPILIVLILICSYFFPNHFLLASLTILVITFNIINSNDEKMNLNRALYYARTKESFKKQFINFIFIILFLIIIYFLKDFIPKNIQEKSLTIYLAIAVLSYVFRINFFNFNNGVKSFEEGIELPKQINNSIAWNSINSIILENEKLIIDIKNKGTFTFLIDDRDIADAINIKNQFEKNMIV
jgi:energy-coupling factor transporter transmembrane protein EcfT